MKKVLLSLLVIPLAFLCGAWQKDRYEQVDRYARSVGRLPLKELAAKLTAPYPREEDKVRSVFIWITQHIAYDIQAYNHPDDTRYDAYKSLAGVPEGRDDFWPRVWAAAALKDGMAVCEGYASLFRVLCDEAGIRSVIIHGNGRWPADIGLPWVENHAWNAVWVAGKWQLLDVTWSAGYNYEYQKRTVKKLPAYYYFTDPAVMIRDHYPDSLKWSLLDKPPSRKEYSNRPYYWSGSGPGPVSWQPAAGVLEVKMGDSLRFAFRMSRPCHSVTIWDTGNLFQYHYVPEAGAASEQPVAGTGSRAAGKQPPARLSKDYTAAVDAMFEYIDAVPVPAAGTDNSTSTASAVTGPAVIPLNGKAFFRQRGDTVYVACPVAFKGSHLLQIAFDGDLRLVYRVDSR